MESTSKKIVESVDDTIPELPLKDLVGILCFALLAFSFLFLHVWTTMLCYASVGFSRLAESLCTFVIVALGIQRRFKLAASAWGSFSMFELTEGDVMKQIFRIYRDIRFSNDRTPYKVSISFCQSE